VYFIQYKVMRQSIDFIEWRKCMGIEPTHQLVTGALVLKTRRPTRRLGTSTVL